MMAAGIINEGGEVLRKLLVCAVDVSENAETPVWEVQGYKVEESSVEFEVDEETTTDILGNDHNTVNAMVASQSFDPNTLRTGAKLSELLLQYWRDGQTQKFSQFKVLLIYAFMGAAGKYEADLWSKSTIRPDGLGGSSRVDMPFTITYGGDKTKGTASDYKGAGIVFTPAVEGGAL